MNNALRNINFSRQLNTYDDALTALINYANTQGYNLPSQNYLDALDRWIRFIKAIGRWEKTSILYNFANDGDDNFRRLNYIDPAIYPCTESGNLQSTPMGYEGDNAGSYFSTGFNPAAETTPYSLNDASRGAYIYKTFTEDNTIDGVPGVSNNVMRNTSSANHRINSGASSSLSTPLDLSGTGFKFLSRDGANSVQGINHGVETLATSASTSLGSLVQCIFRSAETGYGDCGLSCYLMGASISEAEAVQMDAAFEIYLTETGLVDEISYDEALTRVIKYAEAQGYRLPSQPYLSALNRWVRFTKLQGRWEKTAILYNFANDGDDDFKRLNYIDPTQYQCDKYGDLVSTPMGYEGNNIDAYLSTGFNPALETTPYTLNDASRGAYIYKAFTDDNTIDGVPSLSNNVMRNASSTGQRVNSGTSSSLSPLDLSGTGFKFLSRDSASSIAGINNGIETSVPSASSGLASLIQCIFKSAETGYGDCGISCYMMGASISETEANDFDAAFNLYLIEAGLLVPTAYDDALVNVINYATAQGYDLPSQPYLDALDKWIRVVKAQGRWSKTAILYNFANDGDENFRMLNYIDPAQYACTKHGNPTATNLGYEGNNVNAYFSTGFNPAQVSSSYTLDDASRGAYIYKPYTDDSAVDGVNSLNDNVMRNNSNLYQRINSGTSSSLSTPIDLSGVGFKFLSRNDANSVKGISNGVERLASSASTALTNATQNILKSAVTGFGDCGISSYIMGASINGTEAIEMDAAFEAYLNAVGLLDTTTRQLPKFGFTSTFSNITDGSNGIDMPMQVELMRNKRGAFARATLTVSEDGTPSASNPAVKFEAFLSACEQYAITPIICVRSRVYWVDYGLPANDTNADISGTEAELATIAEQLYDKHFNLMSAFTAYVKTHYSHAGIIYECDNEPELFRHLLKDGSTGTTASGFWPNKVRVFIPAIKGMVDGALDGDVDCRPFSPANAGWGVTYLYDRIVGTSTVPSETGCVGYSFHWYSNQEGNKQNFPDPNFHSKGYTNIAKYWWDRYQKPMVYTEGNYRAGISDGGQDAPLHQQRQINFFNTIYPQILEVPELICWTVYAQLEPIERGDDVDDYGERAFGWDWFPDYDPNASPRDYIEWRRSKAVVAYVKNYVLT